MLELWQLATYPTILPITAMLGIILLYWGGVILGALDMDMFQIDLDTDVDPGLDMDMDANLDVDADMDADADTDLDPSGAADGFMTAFLSFMNLGKVPFMIVLSAFTLSFWSCAMIMTKLLPLQNPWLGVGLYVPYLLAAVMATKALTTPLVSLFASFKDEGMASAKAQMCTLLSETNDLRLSQGRIDTQGAPIIVNVKARPGQTIPKGSRALIIEKDPTQDFYYVEYIAELENEL